MRQRVDKEERWAGIPGFPDYAVSTNGDIMNLKRQKRLSHRVDKKGFHSVVLRDNGKPKCFLIGRLVLGQFKGEQPQKIQVKYLDGDRSNNKLENLEWIPRKENSNYDAGRELLDAANRRKVKCLDTGVVYDSIRQAHKETGICLTSLSSAARGVYKHAGGYEWKYLD